jgi:hypothetical protein
MENRIDEALDLENAMNTLGDISSGKTNGASGKGPDDRKRDNAEVTFRTEYLACTEGKNPPA